MKTAKRILLLCLVSAFSLPALSQQYRNDALYIILKEKAKVSAKSLGKDAVPLEKLDLKISRKKNNAYGLHPEAFSMSLFNNTVLDRTFKIQFDSTARIEEIIRILEKDPKVEKVERIPIFQNFGMQILLPDQTGTKAAPTDPYYQDYEGYDLQWYLKMIHAEEALELQSGNPSVKLAVVDAAIWGEHPDLAIPKENQYQTETGENNSSPEAFSKQDEDCTLYEVWSGKCNSYRWSHGTHCMGLAGAKNNNGEGIASLGSGSTLLAVGSGNAAYPSSVMDGYAGIRWAAENGAKVISCSWGNSATEGNDIGEAILKECYDNGIVIVAAAGNESSKLRCEPASSIYVIGVSSVDEDGKLSEFSNYGKWVTISAPGGFSQQQGNEISLLSSTYCTNQRLYQESDIPSMKGTFYDTKNGTSMATPVVAGLCALMLSRNPDLTPGQIKDILQNTSVFNPANQDSLTALAGCIDAEAAIKAVDGAKFDLPVSKLYRKRQLGDSVWLAWEAPTASQHEILGYNIFHNGILVDSCVPGVQENPNLTERIWPVGNLKPGLESFMVSVVYADGYESCRTEVRTTVQDLFKISVKADPDSAGVVYGGGNYQNKNRVTLKAVPRYGFLFKYWESEGEEVSTKASYTITVNGEKEYIAHFEIDPDPDPVPEPGDTTLNETAETENLVRIVPNPAKENILVESSSPISRIEICDLGGRTVLCRKNIAATRERLPLNGLVPGTYIVRIHTENGTAAKKLVRL